MHFNLISSKWYMWLPCLITWQREFPAGFQSRHEADALVPFVIFALWLRGVSFFFFMSVLCGSSADSNGSWPAGGPLCACFRDTACWWVTMKKRWPLHSFIMGRSAKVRVDKLHYEALSATTTKKAAFPTTFWPLRKRDRSEMCRRRYRDGQKGVLIKENSLLWCPGMILW